MDDMISGAPVVALVPGLVEIAKRDGKPTRFAGLAAIAIATLLVALADLSLSADSTLPLRRLVAGWALAGVIYGLAGAGLYSQAQRLPVMRPERSEIGVRRGIDP